MPVLYKNEDMRERARTDFFPWILGAVVAVAIAVPATIAIHRANTSPPPLAAPANSTPVNVQPAALVEPAPPPPSAQPAVSPAPSPAAQPTASPEPPPAKVWQCTVNGQRIFSDAPCGPGASLRQLSEVNRMDPTPEPRNPVYVYPSPPPAYFPAPAEEYAPPPPTPFYATQPGLLIFNQARREHEHEEEEHEHARGREDQQAPAPVRPHVRGPRPPHHERNLAERK
jgi:hypothetical protein